MSALSNTGKVFTVNKIDFNRSENNGITATLHYNNGASFTSNLNEDQFISAGENPRSATVNHAEAQQIWTSLAQSALLKHKEQHPIAFMVPSDNIQLSGDAFIAARTPVAGGMPAQIDNNISHEESIQESENESLLEKKSEAIDENQLTDIENQKAELEESEKEEGLIEKNSEAIEDSQLSEMEKEKTELHGAKSESEQSKTKSPKSKNKISTMDKYADMQIEEIFAEIDAFKETYNSNKTENVKPSTKTANPNPERVITRETSAESPENIALSSQPRELTNFFNLEIGSVVDDSMWKTNRVDRL